MGTNAEADNDIRRQATWMGSKTVKPFLIKIKEVPQTRLKPIKVRYARQSGREGAVLSICVDSVFMRLLNI
jgi:hypothetical protein